MSVSNDHGKAFVMTCANDAFNTWATPHLAKLACNDSHFVITRASAFWHASRAVLLMASWRAGGSKPPTKARV